MRWRTANNNRRSKDLRERLHAHGLERIWLKIDFLEPKPILFPPPLSASAYKAIKSAADRAWDSSATDPSGLPLISIAHPAKS